MTFYLSVYARSCSGHVWVPQRTGAYVGHALLRNMNFPSERPPGTRNSPRFTRFIICTGLECPCYLGYLIRNELVMHASVIEKANIKMLALQHSQN